MGKVSRNLKEVRELVMHLCEGKAFVAEGTACVRAIRQEHSPYVRRIVWRPVGLDGHEQGGK